MSSTTSLMSMSTSTPTAPSATPTATTPPPPQQSGPQSSPLLFFVALGFGVVFTNLWIIVGVKYCFRYNARNRPRHDENGDPIDLATMPRQHRRRREKKLMSLDEVNERFPILKYKTWVSTRAEEGLPTAGGVAAPSSRPVSIKDHDPTSDERRLSSTEVERPKTAVSAKVKDEGNTETTQTANTEDAPRATNAEPTIAPPPDDTEDVDEDDPIHAAVPTEMLANPGDSCAICIDTLEDDDDVRGLTCGHAFHASCVDPWLTSRRACCPLCKADYYVPKPRPEGEQNQETDRPTGRRSTNSRIDLQGAPALNLLTGRRDGRSRSNRSGGRRGRVPPSEPVHSPPVQTSRFLRLPRFSRQNTQPQAADQPAPEVSGSEQQSQQPQQHWTSRLRPSIPRPQMAFWRRRGQNSAEVTPGTESEPTPSQLEAGAR